MSTRRYGAYLGSAGSAPPNVGTSSTGGVNVPLNGGTAARKGPAQAWYPTVSFLFFLVIAEYVILLALRYFFRSVHGG